MGKFDAARVEEKEAIKETTDFVSLFDKLAHFNAFGSLIFAPSKALFGVDWVNNVVDSLFVDWEGLSLGNVFSSFVACDETWHHAIFGEHRVVHGRHDFVVRKLRVVYAFCFNVHVGFEFLTRATVTDALLDHV